jgi:hypothetical protein
MVLKRMRIKSITIRIQITNQMAESFKKAKAHSA